MKTLDELAALHGFRPPLIGETTSDYRYRLAAFVATVDRIAAHEIRIGKEFSQWTPAERADCLRD